MRLANLPAGTVILTAPVATVEAGELVEGDLITIDGSTVTVTGTEPCDLPGMVRLFISYRPYDNDIIRCQGWVLPANACFTPLRLLRTDRVTCVPCSTTYDVRVDRASEGRIRSWVCLIHAALPVS
ncbi:hypothetical protein N4G70_31955 [Streptomyces sp. ASQP_92]|uniref:hypothetical protein n=1 Tax=Streptomyces sp. ASQP_92 TaxID=2979116 RepID=UPI0021BEA585|nr:hypothetical protein [Streptomyces sp. ASQP_92]MCT9093449.1 hypothetical protein [Streptomyces sp. ASQP_92]